MRRWRAVAIPLLAVAGAAGAQGGHAHHDMAPSEATADASGTVAHAGQRDAPAGPHAGHAAPAGDAGDAHAGHDRGAPDHHGGHADHAGIGAEAAGNEMVGHGGTGRDPAHMGAESHGTTGRPPPPPPAGDHAADAFFDPAAMARARAALARESGGLPFSMLMIDRLEWRPAAGHDAYEWEIEGWTGGDIDRLAIKSRGEGRLGGRTDEIEMQIGWWHAIDPWFNLRAGVRQDLAPRPRRTQAVLAMEGLAPYWFEVEGELFLSDAGDVTARGEASYDQRLTQRLILQPRAEIGLAAQDAPELGIGAGLSSVELGLRLRYEIAREFAPYIGIVWEKRVGRTARLARAAGDDADALRLAAGVRFWF